jgi:hypothetical protein
MSPPGAARSQTGPSGRRRRADGPADLGDELGHDPALQSLAAQTTSAAQRPVLVPPPSPQAPAEPPATGPGSAQLPGPATQQPAVPAAAHPVSEPGPSTGQATVAVSVDVAQRFRRHQNHLATKGGRPSNGAIVFAALNEGQGRFSEIVAARQPRPEPGQLFGAPVPARRLTSEAKPSQPLSFRPTPQEKALIAELAKQSGAASMAAFLDAVLDDYLARHGFAPSRTASHG